MEFVLLFFEEELLQRFQQEAQTLMAKTLHPAGRGKKHVRAHLHLII